MDESRELGPIHGSKLEAANEASGASRLLAPLDGFGFALVGVDSDATHRTFNHWRFFGDLARQSNQPIRSKTMVHPDEMVVDDFDLFDVKRA
jgi:hypothetical protein